MAKTIKGYKPLLLLLILGLVLRLFLSVQIYSGDVNNHIAWGRDSLDQGFSGIYDREFFFRYGTLPPTYPPIPLFAFTAFHRLYDWTYDTSWRLNLAIGIFPSNFIFFLEDQDTLPAFLKIPAIFADLGIALLVFLFIKKLVKEKSARWPLIGASLILFNPAFFYNSSYWGQIESVPLFFVLLSFYLLLFSQRHIWPAVLFTLALLVKQTSIVFVPLFALVYFLRLGFIRSVKGLLSSAAVFWLAFLPFYKTGNIFTFPFSTYWDKIQTGSGSDFVTDHAFNLWALITGLGKISDSTPFYLGFPYRWWGYFLFAGISFAVLYLVYRRFDIKRVLFAAALLPLAAFLFLTRMHERYLEQALPFFLLAGVQDKKVFLAFILLSVFHFANLYHNWWAPRLDVVVDFLSRAEVINGIIILTIGSFLFLFVKYFQTKSK